MASIYPGIPATVDPNDGVSIQVKLNNDITNVGSAFSYTKPMATLTAATGATVDGNFDITFTDNSNWRNNITSITIDGTTLDPSAYNKTVVGKITFSPSASTILQSSGTKSIVFIATSYPNHPVRQVSGDANLSLR